MKTPIGSTVSMHSSPLPTENELKALIQEGLDSGIDVSFDLESHLASLKARKKTHSQAPPTPSEI
jgi:hypothetical protein